jgi:hypothetical protein
VAASSHVKSVSTANIKTLHYPKPYKQYAITTNPAPIISKMLLPQSNIMAAFVHSNSKFLSGSSPGLPTYKNHHGIDLTIYSLSRVVISVSFAQGPAQYVQMSKYNITFYSLNAYLSYILRSSRTSEFIAYNEAGHVYCRRQLSL